ncbi:DNA-binding XRE family transcriptional regulator [Sedimentibacter acidaminivorans]|uniref:DNA-binding XRE family transcriptional regulator n=1 Tax=Sedimentibacter acidaminivorans TaxID=913099 RepID=A0ABS4GGQ3_9FIRM|nr:helix-turn-helix domain-containing protein [Sedimentibacter acidaminivorans]MBP1926879.1 DNA-binding XRE family transcriptional regulator [Sedimentibacter acidaminivorans]
MNKIKLLREKNNIRQNEIAQFLNISACNYYKKETGDLRFSLIEAKKLSDYFGLTIEELFFTNKVSENETTFQETG